MLREVDVEADLTNWIAGLFADPNMLRMGHGQRSNDLNLGLGWLYYALTRIVRPARVVVIGSYRGFTPLVFGRALQDNREGGEVTFIDPSLADDFWGDPQAVEEHFKSYGVRNVRHHRVTTQQYVESESYRSLGDVGLVLIDGYHTEKQAEWDYRAFESRVGPRGFFLFHDSMVVRPDRVYGSENSYEMTVKYFIDRLKQDPQLQVMDLPFGLSGLTLVRKIDSAAPDPLRDWIEGVP